MRLAPGNNMRIASHALLWACLAGFVLTEGCGTVDSKNTSATPWNRPTKAEISKGWWFRNGYADGPGNHYP
jgi:hypothetical protein